MRSAAHKRRKRSREGAVLIEAIIVFSGFILMFGLLIFVHQLGAVRMHMFQEAHAKAWDKAVRGCPGDNISVGEFMRGLGSGDLPIPDSLLPGEDYGVERVETKMEGLAGQVIPMSIEISIPCQSDPPAADGDGVGIASELFGS